MTRNGKIARLPRRIREQLNRRLEDGEQGEPLLEWLNELPEVAEVLKRQFGGVPINKQSLSQWRLGGYQDWLRHEESCEAVQQLAEQAGDLNAEADEQSISEMIADLLSVELARALRAMLAEATDAKERWRQLQELLPQLSQLRRADHRAARLRMDQERWEKEREGLENEEWARKLQKAKNQALAPFWDGLKRRPLAEVFGGGEAGEKIADHILRVQNMDLPEWGEPSGPGHSGSDAVRRSQTQSDPVRPSQTQSDPVRVNPTKKMPHERSKIMIKKGGATEFAAIAPAWMNEMPACAGFPACHPMRQEVRPGQTRSDQPEVNHAKLNLSSAQKVLARRLKLRNHPRHACHPKVTLPMRFGNKGFLA